MALSTRCIHACVYRARYVDDESHHNINNSQSWLVSVSNIPAGLSNHPGIVGPAERKVETGAELQQLINSSFSSSAAALQRTKSKYVAKGET